MHIQPPQDRNQLESIFKNRPVIIAGPCSAESETQVLESAQKLKATGKVQVLRAGIWKPRTRPGNFEGMGAVALSWLKKASHITGLPVAVEVANPRQLEAALAAGVDLVWLGARTTANPFMVQELADALKGTGVPVLVKNPVNPDTELWIGAVERLRKADARIIGLIHRGFSSYKNTQYRNPPMWPLAIEMKGCFQDLPLLVDPSHICGRRASLPETLQLAIDLGYDGAMVEAHPDPDRALSDAAQQVTPEQLSAILSQLIWRRESLPPEAVHEELELLRRQIDQLDDTLLHTLSERMQIAESIGAYKAAHTLTILQLNRWKRVLERVSTLGARLGLSPEFIRHYYDAIHMESIRHQDLVMNKKTSTEPGA